MRLKLYEEGPEHRFGIDQPMLPIIVLPAAIAPPETAEKAPFRILIGELGGKDVFHDTGFHGRSAIGENVGSEAQVVHAYPIQHLVGKSPLN